MPGPSARSPRRAGQDFDDGARRVSARKRTRTPGSIVVVMLWGNATRSSVSPPSPALRSAALRFTRARTSVSSSTSGTRARASGRGMRRPLSRMNSSKPISASRAVRWRLMADCESPQYRRGAHRRTGRHDGFQDFKLFQIHGCGCSATALYGIPRKCHHPIRSAHTIAPAFRGMRNCSWTIRQEHDR